MNPRAGGVHPFVPFALVIVGLSVVLAWRFTPEFFSLGALADPDGYMRLVRVRLLAEGGGWFDSLIPRSNWPHGEVHHWSRPLDALILLGAWLLTPVAGFENALHQSGMWITTALLLATFGVTAWASEPVVGRRGRGFVLLVLLAQPAVMSYALPGRADHHALILLCFALALGFALRGLADPAERRWAWGLGAATALGMWVSPEFLLPLGVFLAAGMLLWVVRGGELAHFQTRWTGALALGTSVAVVIERGGGALAVEYDRVSVVHVVVGGLALLVWLALEGWQKRAGRGPRGRIVAAALASAAALLAMAFAFPPFLGGPMVEVTDPATRAWLATVTELLPHLMPDDRRGVGLFLAHAGAAVLALGYLTLGVRRGTPRIDLGARLLLLVGITVCLGLAVLQARWITYVEVLAAPALAALILRLRERWTDGDGSVGAALARASASAALVAGPLLAGALLIASLEPRARTGAVACEPEAVAAFLARESPWSEAPHTVAAYTDLGPVLLYRTHHRVLATPYHRNQQGIRRTVALMNAVDEPSAREIVTEAEIDLIVLCPALDRLQFAAERGGQRTLYTRLLEGEPPGWIVEEGVPAELRGVRLYRVNAGRGVADLQRSGQSARYTGNDAG